MLEITYLKTADLIPYVNNSRTHSDSQVTQVASSIKEFGFTNPILVDDEGGIIAGHGRLLAAKKLKLETVPCITLSGLTEAQKKAYVIADNKLSLNSGWDEETLAAELEALGDLGFDISLTGFDMSEISEVLGDDDISDSSEIDEGIDYQEAFSVVVICEDAVDQEARYKQLTQLGMECKVLVN